MKEKNCIVFVKSDFFLFESNFDVLRDFISHLDSAKVEFLDEFNYDLENNKVVHIHQPYHPDYSNLSLMCNLIENGYIAINFCVLKKKILSL